jgi:Domain of unknown function (DUF5668)
MNCVYHAEVPNAAFCIRCGHPLCSECVRSVRGSVYCEACLAEAVEGKTAGRNTPPPLPPPTARPETIVGTNPVAAFVLGLIPGVGAIYNGEFVKAAIHVLMFATLISLSEFGPQPLIGLMIAAFVFYMPFEAYYTAKKRQLRVEQGIELETPIDRLQQQFGDVKDRELWAGVILIVIGGLYLLGNLDVFEMARVARFWPALLVVAGVWLLKKHQDKAE